VNFQDVLNISFAEILYKETSLQDLCMKLQVQCSFLIICHGELSKNKSMVLQNIYQAKNVSTEYQFAVLKVVMYSLIDSYIIALEFRLYEQ
jgi:hypothetical protein